MNKACKSMLFNGRVRKMVGTSFDAGWTIDLSVRSELREQYFLYVFAEIKRVRG